MLNCPPNILFAVGVYAGQGEKKISGFALSRIIGKARDRLFDISLYIEEIKTTDDIGQAL
jgi:hypothetical protein